MQATRLLSQQAAAPLVRRVIPNARRGHAPLRHLKLLNPESAVPTPKPRLRAGRDLLQRIGKCLAFGCNPQQTADAAAVVRTVVNDWARIEMTLSKCGTQEDLVYKQTLLRPGDEASLATPEPTWKVFGQRQQLSQVACQATMHLLNHAIATAAPDRKWIWHALRAGDITGSPGRLAVDATRLRFQPVRLPLDIITGSGEELGSHSAYARLLTYSLFSDRACLTFKVYIRSNIRMAVIADGFVQMSTSFNQATPDAISSLKQELGRMTAFQHDRDTQNRARIQHAELLNAIEKLENETWNRDDAVEDFGSASPASPA
ncbi:hypothetical protein CGRA01v4_14397 [Colletotrichum graminicola]|uniref:Uncharacterized protein n=1 Tax=Colletotrichum graminicola (strain M1.001 / M2 / FGSC 10212) TaxID=645133 RepID=E3Q5L6_COLGM|nr:uncharacterized protein GLRG_01127 [Colletotrichum graminicola M1.001]EFQ25983.1 hypothetical protein GLRG_01127 [Colletotrichum graminicola M1.001]WDK23106.1 hypothetical protein CGRA01v4_14397 [Colletotrichum graminicola]